MKKKIINIFLIIVMLISIFPVMVVNADPVNRVGTSKVGSIVVAYTGGNSQVYVNKITKQDGTVVRYVYSSNFLVTPATIAKLKSVLTSEYSSLIPDNYTSDDNVGIKVCSDSSLVNSMNENWTSSEWVGRNVVAVRSVKNATNETGDGINKTAISNAQSHTVLFNEIKNSAEAGNRAKWEAIEQERKASWDAAEAAHHEEDSSYIPQEYVSSEYVPLDFDDKTAQDIENTRALEANQIELPVNTNLTSHYEFINARLEQVTDICSVNHVASINSSHTIIDDTESITKINTLNIGIASPKVGDTATATTKPTVTLDSNPNYEIDYVAYISSYPSAMPTGYDEPFVGTFEANKDYYVEVSLKAKEGYVFRNNDNMALKVNGKTDNYEMSEWNADDSTYYMFYVKVKATTPSYEYIDNTANQTYTIGKDDNLTFRINADYPLFENGGKVYVDGAETTEYISKSGSTIITLNKSYLNTLSVGKHTLKVSFNNGGSAETTFTIADTTKNETTNNPQTGDNVMFYISMLVLSIIGLAGTGLYIRKRRFN